MPLKLNLQLFAKDGPGGEKTEPASQKKLDDARKKGQVAKSKEIVNSAYLVIIFAFLKPLTGFRLLNLGFNASPEIFHFTCTKSPKK